MDEDLRLYNTKRQLFEYDIREQVGLIDAWNRAKEKYPENDVKALAEILERTPNKMDRIITFIMHYVGDENLNG